MRFLQNAPLWPGVDLQMATSVSEEHNASIFRERLYLPKSPYDVTTQKSNIDTFIAMQTLNFARIIRSGADTWPPRYKPAAEF
jgi:hypothetical protein